MRSILPRFNVESFVRGWNDQIVRFLRSVTSRAWDNSIDFYNESLVVGGMIELSDFCCQFLEFWLACIEWAAPIIVSLN